MLDQFTGRTAGDHAYLECTLATDLSNDYQGEPIPPHKPVDVRLPNGKLLRLPYAWLREEQVEENPRPFPLEEAVANGDLGAMLDATEVEAPAKKVVVKRAAPKQ